MATVKPIPEGYHTITPYLIVEGVPKLIDFLKSVFGAEEMERFTDSEGEVMHAEVRIGDSVLMMGGAKGDWKAMPASLYIYVKDTDAAYNRALQAGATSINEPSDKFYGDRNAGVKDPFGNLWFIATHVEDVSREEMKRRSEEAKQKS
jgi:PhnB protein